MLPPDLATAETLEKGHGRIETRQIAVSAEVVAHLAWPGCAQVARIERERRISDKVSTEVASIITSLTVAEAGPARLLDLSRGHWAIESAPQAHKKEVRYELNDCAQAAWKMKVDPSKSAFRSGLQTTPSGCG